MLAGDCVCVCSVRVLGEEGYEDFLKPLSFFGLLFVNFIRVGSGFFL